MPIIQRYATEELVALNIEQLQEQIQNLNPEVDEELIKELLDNYLEKNPISSIFDYNTGNFKINNYTVNFDELTGNLTI